MTGFLRHARFGRLYAGPVKNRPSVRLVRRSGRLRPPESLEIKNNPKGRLPESSLFCLPKLLGNPARTGLPALFRRKISASFPVLFLAGRPPAEKKALLKNGLRLF